MQTTFEIPPHFMDYVFDWEHEQYLLVGGYGSGKSYETATKIILKLLQETRKVLVLRDVYDSIKESCFDLFVEILSKKNLLANPNNKTHVKTKVVMKVTPLELKFPNGSRIIFKGLDDVSKVRSINGISIVWLEECSEIKHAAYLEILGRIRVPDVSLHFIMTCNPVSRENWVFKHFFSYMDEKGKIKTIMDEDKFYAKRKISQNNIYYHHSTQLDNPFLPKIYRKRLNELKSHDPYLYRVAVHGKFGVTGLKVLPQFEIAKEAAEFKQAINDIPIRRHFFGFDFGFETSFNCLISMAVDDKEKILYIYDEIYVNGITDDKMAVLPDMLKFKEKQQRLLKEKRVKRPISADNEDPKAINYYSEQGYIIRPTIAKFNGSKISNTRKLKRFKKIICSPKCINTIRELSDLTYKKDRQNRIKYDEFNIDAHSMSAIWYGLDTVNVTDLKMVKSNSKSGQSEITVISDGIA